MIAKGQAHYIAQRQAVMSNPYHAGFSGNDTRDPFGGAQKKIKTQDEALQKLADMMDKRVQNRKR
jgi:hypothetical protein